MLYPSPMAPRNPLGRKLKRTMSTSTRIEGAFEDVAKELERVQAMLDAAYSPTIPNGVFNMADADSSARSTLIEWLWAGDYARCNTEILEANKPMEEQLQQRTKSRTTGDLEQHELRRRPRLNFIAGIIGRSRSKNVMPLHQVLLGIDAKHKMVNKQFWDQLTSVSPYSLADM